MDCGAWTSKPAGYVVRIRGNEYSFTGEQLSELCRHLNAVRDGAAESLSEDYLDLRTLRKNEAKGVSLVKKLGLDKLPAKKPAQGEFRRRI